jgi:opacity protein-like surface antigen
LIKKGKGLFIALTIELLVAVAIVAEDVDEKQVCPNYSCNSFNWSDWNGAFSTLHAERIH